MHLYKINKIMKAILNMKSKLSNSSKKKKTALFYVKSNKE